MDKLVAEKQIEESEVKVTTQEKESVVRTEEIVVKEKPPVQTEYLNSFENLTVADVRREEEKRQKEEFEIEKEKLIAESFQTNESQVEEQTEEKTEEQTTEKSEESKNIIEKPNYDFIEENKKVIKLKKNTSQKKVKNKKVAGIALALALGGSAILCVANTIILDNMNFSLLQIDETYKLNLGKYLKDIAGLDSTKKSMEFLETYPEELLDAGELGHKTNWFDKLCNFFGGLFGG